MLLSNYGSEECIQQLTQFYLNDSRALSSWKVNICLKIIDWVFHCKIIKSNWDSCTNGSFFIDVFSGEEPVELLAEPCAINSFDIDRQNPSVSAFLWIISF